MPEKNTVACTERRSVLRVFLIWNCPKTASERPQSGPVTPSASNEEVHGPRSMYSGCPSACKQGGTA